MNESPGTSGRRSDDLVQFVYASTLAAGYDEDELVSILSIARRKNAALGVTGLLLYSNRSFFQILEGPNYPVSMLYDRIARDHRHDRVVRLLDETIAQRQFRDWTMGLAQVSGVDLEHETGMAGFFSGGRNLADLNPEQARTLLQALSHGRLRMRCESNMVSALIGPVADRPGQR